MTWEPSSALPSHLIQQYEEGLLTETSIKSEASYGVVTNTIVVNSAVQPTRKRSKTVPERLVTKDLEG